MPTSNQGHSRIESTINQIIQYISDEGLKDGDQLPTERELSVMFGVGRSTLREALSSLATRNVLEVRRGVGTFVSYKHGVAEDPLGFTLIKDRKKLALDLLEFRILIEPRIAALAAIHATPDEIAELEYLCDAVDELILAGKPHMPKDMEFHTRIARCSQNLIMPKILPIIHSSINIFITETQSALRTETMRTHRAILNAIKHHDSAAAYDAMMLHLIYNRDLLRDDSITSGGTYCYSLKNPN